MSAQKMMGDMTKQEMYQELKEGGVSAGTSRLCKAELQKVLQIKRLGEYRKWLAEDTKHKAEKKKELEAKKANQEKVLAKLEPDSDVAQEKNPMDTKEWTHLYLRVIVSPQKQIDPIRLRIRICIGTSYMWSFICTKKLEADWVRHRPQGSPRFFLTELGLIDDPFRSRSLYVERLAPDKFAPLPSDLLWTLDAR